MLHEIIERIDLLSEEAGISNSALSIKALGHNDTIRSIKRSVNKPNYSIKLNTLKAIADALDTSVIYLLTGIDIDDVDVAILKALKEASPETKTALAAGLTAQVEALKKQD